MQQNVLPNLDIYHIQQLVLHYNLIQVFPYLVHVLVLFLLYFYLFYLFLLYAQFQAPIEKNYSK